MVALSSLCSSVLEDIARLCLGKQRKFENTIMSLYSWESLTWSVSSISGFCSSGKILHGLGAIKSNRWPKERAKQDFRGHTWTISQSGGFMWMRCSRVSLYHTWSLGLLPLAPLWVHFVHSILPKTLSMNMSPSATVIKFNCWTCKHGWCCETALGRQVLFNLQSWMTSWNTVDFTSESFDVGKIFFWWFARVTLKMNNMLKTRTWTTCMNSCIDTTKTFNQHIEEQK